MLRIRVPEFQNSEEPRFRFELFALEERAFGHGLQHNSRMGCSPRASGLLLGLVLAGCGQTSKPGAGAAGEGGSSAGVDGTFAGSPSAAGGGDASAGISSSGGQGGTPAGGASTGGATGGVFTGGTSAGGVDAGAAGSAGSTTTPGAECEVDADCVLVDDCCSCSGEPKDANVRACSAVCKQSACAALGMQGVRTRCSAKRCVLELSCNAALVTCKAAQPSCASGQVPSVLEGCWGPCIDATECREVTDCSGCGAGSTCVTESMFVTTAIHCVSVSPACESAPSCQCVDACSVACGDADGKIGCFCPGC